MDRRLTAILAADVVGYSKHMEYAEEATAKLLDQCQHTIADTANRLGGRIFNTAGDSALAEFSSPVNAVRCGVEIQRAICTPNYFADSDFQLPLRIGVHLADVIVSGEDLLGDGVNIAARIQEAAEPSSVFVSQVIFEHLRRNSPFVFEDVGLRTLKNISEQMHLYKVAGDMPTWGFKNSHSVSRPAARAVRPSSLAVLPFEVAGGDEEQRYFADGLTDDLIFELAQFKKLFVSSRSASTSYDPQSIDPQVVGRELGVKYVLVGQVRRTGSDVRITVRLIDSESGQNIWAKRYSRSWTELFELLDEMTAQIASTLVGQVESSGINEAMRKRPEDMVAYDYLLRGLGHHRLGGVTEGNIREAVSWFDRAIEADPNFGLPYAWHVCASSWLPDFDYDKGLKYATRAIELDENNGEAHRIMGSYQMMMGNFEKSEYHHCRAMQLNPNDAYIRARSAAFYTYNHQPERALELVAEAEALDPLMPVWCLEEKGVALFALGRFEEAISALNSLSFQTFRTCGYAAASAMALGDRVRSSRAIDDALRIRPGLTASAILNLASYRSSDDATRLRNLLIEAGLPE